MKLVRLFGFVKSIIVGADGTPVTVTGGKLDVNAAVTPTDVSALATKAKQDDLLAEVVKKPNLTDTLLTDLALAIKQLVQVIANPPTTNKATNRNLVTVDAITIAANQDLRTLAALTAVDSYQGRVLMVGASQTAWALICRSRIS